MTPALVDADWAVQNCLKHTASLSSLVIVLYHSEVTFQKASNKYLVYFKFQFVIEMVHTMLLLRVVINVVEDNSVHMFLKTMDLKLFVLVCRFLWYQPSGSSTLSGNPKETYCDALRCSFLWHWGLFILVTHMSVANSL